MGLTDRGKVKRFYALKTPDFSSKSLRTIFDKHISKTAQVTTDEWKGYRPIKDYNITQKPSNDGKKFPIPLYLSTRRRNLLLLRNSINCANTYLSLFICNHIKRLQN